MALGCAWLCSNTVVSVHPLPCTIQGFGMCTQNHGQRVCLGRPAAADIHRGYRVPRRLLRPVARLVTVATLWRLEMLARPVPRCRMLWRMLARTSSGLGSTSKLCCRTSYIWRTRRRASRTAWTISRPRSGSRRHHSGPWALNEPCL